MSLNVEQIRAQFPVLQEQANGQPLVYLDNAATTQKPQAVIDALVEYYSTYNSNVHRGAHFLSDKATRRYEEARQVVAQYLNASRTEEVIWTSGTTEG
ncbi:MAG: aminotransferase class V-fold PLP-dependent enzyme, partial [Pseudomonadota bacterium]|nr:aminotransferase class V-fold PLP-dependent enzyme [Pseudomonadota bacterium]